MKKLTHKRLLEQLHYNRHTGVFTWRVNKCRQAKAGKIAGCIDSKGHRQICVDAVQYSAHRLAWFYVKKRWPRREIDHKNRRRDDNWFSNLRQATHRQNCKNRTVNVNNTSGFKGVNWVEKHQHFVVRIQENGDRKYLGVYKELDEAAAIYAAASKKYHGRFGTLGEKYP